MKKPFLILIRGLPGSGKSYIATAMKERLRNDEVVIIDPDMTNYNDEQYVALSQSLSKNGVEEKFHPYRFLRAQAQEAIRTEKIIIWNQAFTNLDGFKKTIANLSSIAEEHKLVLPILVVEVIVDAETAKKRIQSRVKDGGHEVSDEEFDRFINDFESFKNEDFNLIAVNGSENISDNVDIIYDAIQSPNNKV